MVHFEWFKKLPRLTDDIQENGDVHDEEAESDLDYGDSDSNSGVLSDLFIIIDYTNAGGISTRRPITIKRETVGASLGFFAFCHRRKQLRQFRFDRIKAVITADGEVFEPSFLFWKQIGYHAAAEIHVTTELPNDRYAATWVKRKFNHELVILAALSGSDGNMHKRELDVIVDFVERELEWERASLDAEEALALRNHIKRMRITQERIGESVDALLHGEGRYRLYSRQLERFFSVARQVSDADGFYHKAEHEFLSYLASHAQGEK